MMSIRKISMDYKILKRYKQIGEVLVKYGFHFVVEKLYDKGFVPSWILKRPSIIGTLTPGQRIRFALEELGPTFIKLGQILSTRTDIIPESIIKELSLLQDQAPEFPFSIAQELFHEQLGMHIKEAFEYFEEKPIAAASIGQVYCAKLKNHQEVVVKFQRPDIAHTIKQDISILKTMAKILDEHFSKQIPFKMVDVIEEFSYTMIRELDYMIEARNTEKFRENFKDNSHVIIPKVYWEYSTTKILTLEKINGFKIADVLDMKNVEEWNTKLIADRIIESFMKQIFVFGFFHADPHPGNIFVVSKDKIAFIDFGITGYLDKYTMNFITDLFIAGAKKDVEKITNLLIEIDAIPSQNNTHRLKEDLSFILNFYLNIPLKKLNISEAISQFMKITYRNHIRLPSQFTQLARTMITLEGSIKRLDPEFSISEAMGQFMDQIMAYKFNPEKLFNETLYYAEDIFYALKTLPKNIRNIIKKLESNEIKVVLEEIEFRKFADHLNKITNKLSLSLIVAAIAISSSLIVSYEKGPMIWGLSIFGLFGYLLTLFLSVILVFDILRTTFKKNK